MGLALSTDSCRANRIDGRRGGMMLAGVLNMDEAYSAVNWKTVFLMACLIPLGWALDSTGAANWLAQQTLERSDPGCRSGLAGRHRHCLPFPSAW